MLESMRPMKFFTSANSYAAVGCGAMVTAPEGEQRS
jgi:hypothetical protein